MSNIKAILFDADGVVLKERDKYFNERLREEGKDVNEENIFAFFKNQYKQIVVGKADLKEEVSKAMKEWGWDGSVDELLDYWFSYEDKYNDDVLALVEEMRNKGVKCYLASDHSRWRADNLQNSDKLNGKFDGGFFSGCVGYTKEEPEFFEKVLEQLNLSKDEVVFIDDDPENVKIAEEFGIRSTHFSSVENLKEFLDKIN